MPSPTVGFAVLSRNISHYHTGPVPGSGLRSHHSAIGDYIAGRGRVVGVHRPRCELFVCIFCRTLTLSGVQSRLGDKLLRIWLASPHNETTVLKGSKAYFLSTSLFSWVRSRAPPSSEDPQKTKMRVPPLHMQWYVSTREERMNAIPMAGCVMHVRIGCRIFCYVDLDSLYGQTQCTFDVCFLCLAVL